MKRWLAECIWRSPVSGIKNDAGLEAVNSISKYPVEVIAEDVIEAKFAAAREAIIPDGMPDPRLAVTVLGPADEFK